MKNSPRTRVLAPRKSAPPARLPKSYQLLMREFALRPIHSAAEYECAAKIIHRLAMREDRLDAGEAAYLEVLETMIERHDAVHHAMQVEGITPTAALRVLVEQAGMTVTELGELLGSKGAASELLGGKRKEPSKAKIARLCARFSVDAALFLNSARRPANAV